VEGRDVRLLITGASGQLGAYLLRQLRGTRNVSAWTGSRQGELFGFPLTPVDLTNTHAVAQAYLHARPDAIIHTAAWARVSDCFQDPVTALRVNVGGTAILADLAAKSRSRLVLVSTDLVFDGEDAPYREEHNPSPLSVYGKSKVAAEQALLGLPRAVVARLSLLYGPSLTGRPSFFDDQVSAVSEDRALRLFHDEWRTPLNLTSAAQALLALTSSEFCGVLHVGGPGRLSRWEMGQLLAQFLGKEAKSLVAVSRADIPAAEPRPRDTSLDSSSWRAHFPSLPWPGWDEALQQML
jgi:dTDP-4-dehydrorhamnose reductase